jgi:VCBS repeat-containing protein
MRPTRLVVLITTTLLAALLLVPTALAGTAAAQAQAQVTFSAPTDFAAGESPVSVATGDFNADNDPDLAVANRFSSTVSVLLGGLGGGFTGPTNFPTGFFSNSVAVGNFNGDQDPDLAVANAFDGMVSVLLGGPGGGFTGPTNFAAGSPYVVAVGDFNRDGDPDLVVADHVAGDLSVLVGGPGGSFSGPTTIATGTGTAAVAVGEFNQDGDPDLAVGDYDTGRVLVLLGSSSATFTGPTTVATGVDPISVAVGEFNQDGDPDLAVAEESGRVLVLLGGSGGGFTGPTAVLSGSQVLAGLSSVAVGDFNLDGDPDLVVAHRSGNQVRVLLGGAGGSFGSPNDLRTGALPASVAVADFNADGKPDLTTAHPTTNKVAVLLNTTVTNRAPNAAADAYSTTEDTPLTVAAPGVLANDSDPDGNTLSAVLASGPSHGTLSLNPNGSFTYSPAANFHGGDSFTYRASDGALTSSPATVTITVSAVNDAPTAATDAYTTGEDTALTVAVPGVLGNDSDPDGDTLSAVLASGPSHGALTVNANGSFTYTPAANYHGSDSFTYRASDGTLSSSLATVAITVNAVNDAPTAVDDTYTTAEDTALTVDAPGVLVNDNDPEGDSLHTVLGAGPSHGTLTLDADGSFIYTPAANYHGTDSFSYRASDGGLESDLATVAITVSAVNDTPTAADDTYTTAEDTALIVSAPGVLGNDGDLDGNILSATVESPPAHGSLSLNANGSFTYTPAANYHGTDSFTYRASDGTLSSSPATVTITVSAVNDTPAAATDAYATGEDTALTVAAPGVLGNDTDPDGDTLSAVLASGPSHGTLTLDPNGSFTYTPAANFNGSDSFTYRASDGTLTSNLATVTLTVNAANDAPTVTVAAGGTCGKDDHSGTVNLTAADVESPVAQLTVSVASSNLALVPTGNVVVGRSGAPWTMAVSAVDGRSGTAILTVTVSDGQASGSAQVTVTVGGGGKDTLTGGGGADLLLAQSNNDTLTGGGGNDLLCGDSGGDTLSGGAGDDSLGGGSGTDQLTGGLGADLFSGGSGNDTATDFTATEGDTSDGTIP